MNQNPRRPQPRVVRLPIPHKRVSAPAWMLLLFIALLGRPAPAQADDQGGSQTGEVTAPEVALRTRLHPSPRAAMDAFLSGNCVNVVTFP